jgi:hypothetical protein
MAAVETNYADLPHNVSTHAQLALLPEEFLSDDPKRPLKYKTESGDTYTYALQPLLYSVIFIMLIEGLERFSYYGKFVNLLLLHNVLLISARMNTHHVVTQVSQIRKLII